MGDVGCSRSNPEVLSNMEHSDGSIINLFMAKKGKPKIISVHRFRAIMAYTVQEDH